VTLYTPQTQVALAPFTAYHVGGPAQWFDQPRDQASLAAALAWAQHEQIPLTILGAGTNLLISDRGLPGLVLSLRQWQGATWSQDGRIRAQAGEPLARLAWQSARRGWHGLEWAVGIPGSMGGAVAMNAGAHGWDTAQLVVGVVALDPQTGAQHYLSRAELDFGYRRCILQQQKWLVLAVDLQLVPEQDPALLLHQVETYNRHRRQTQPQGLPNCGSVFRNPPDHKAGWLLEQCGLKGSRVGGAQVAYEHANFIVNVDQARAQDIWTLMNQMQTQVRHQFKVDLVAEVKVLGTMET